MRSPCTMYGRDTSSNRHVLQALYMAYYCIQGRTGFECPHSVGFLRCSLQCTITQGAPCPGFVYRIRQAVCKHPRVASALALSAAAVAPRWTRIRNRSPRVPRLGSLPLRPHAGIGAYIIRRCDGQLPMPSDFISFLLAVGDINRLSVTAPDNRLSAPQACPAQSRN